MKRWLWLVLAAAAMAGDRPALKPRASAADYPARSEREWVSLGAALLSPEQVRGAFVSDLNRAYLVVEVGVFPARELRVEHVSFHLVAAGTHDVLRPVEPRTIAGVLQKTARGGRDVTLYPTVGVGYDTWGGWSTGAGVGVGVGGNGPPPASTDRDRSAMETELSEKALPEGPAAQAVAGYLYFPAPRKKDAAYDLECTVGGEKFLLPLGRAVR